MNCVLYARVSTDKQAEHDLSIPAQVQAMRDYASQRGWNVVSEYLEPGASAKTTERPELQRLLGYLRETTEAIDIVLVHKIDRLARNVFDHATIKALLQQRGIRLASVVENIDDSVSGQLVENIMASIAQFYSANLSEEVKKGMRQKVLRGGWPHRPPRGYVLVTSDSNDRARTIAVHPQDGPLMKRAFELYGTGWYSLKSLAMRLAKDGLVASQGQPISAAHLRRLLENSFYAGIVRWHDHEQRGNHPALISRELFDKVQAVIQRRYKNPGPNGSTIPGFPLRGLAICGSCRGKMTAERHGRWSYYRCSRQTYRRALCSARLCNADRAHAALEEICRRVQIKRALAIAIQHVADQLIDAKISELSRTRADLEALNVQLTQKEAALTRTFSRGDIAPNLYREQLDELARVRDELHRLPSRAPTKTEFQERIDRTLTIATSLWHLYDHLPANRRPALLAAVFEVIVLDHSGVIGYSLNSPFNDLCGSDGQRNPADLATSILAAA